MNKRKLISQPMLRGIMLLLADIVCIVGILALVLYVYRLCGARYRMSILLKLYPLPCLIIVLNIFARLYNGSLLYPGISLSPVEEIKRLTLSVIGGYTLLFAGFSLSRTSTSFTRLGLMISMMLTVLLIPIFRYFIRMLMKKNGFGQIPVMIAGAGYTSKLVAYELAKDKYLGFKLVGCVDDNSGNPAEYLPGIPYYGKISSALFAAKKYGIDYLITTLPLENVAKNLGGWLKYFKHLLIIPTNQVLPVLWTYPAVVSCIGGLEIGNRMQRKFYRYCKACADIVISSLTIIFAIPVFCVLALLVKLTSRGPVFYSAERLGQGGKTIKVWKFRTMYGDAEARLAKLLAENPGLKAEWDANFKLDRDPRITWFGNFLRRTSMDELPQIWNILNGEMSLIGPRPIVKEERALYGKSYKTVFRVKPGITGLWQISGRSDLAYEQRVTLDLYYVNNWSVWLDYYILLKTVKEVMMCSGAK